jgi:glycosyltransferase involved in cell wall biosynthesis
MDDFEVICVNDASSDKSKEILNEYHLKDKRIIVINHETNMRVAYSRNEAFKASSGKYIVYVDSDDLIIEKDFFKDCIEKFEANENVDIVIGKCLMVNNPKNLSFKELLAVQPVQMKAMNTFEQDAKQFNIASPKYLLLTKNAQML